MADDFYSGIYNPDVLSCIANLSNDEVFTPPEVANAMLDLLPQELFASTETTFLDPACKSGVFLREIAKRLLAAHFPGYKEALDAINAKKSAGTALTAAEETYLTEFGAGVNHIFHHQLFGIAITELTSLLSRRGVYCSKFPNGEYSVSHFDDAEGNIRFKRIQHRWKDGKCVFCGASQSQYDRDASLETHAYEWIHTTKPEEIWKMKFDVIISNPPYQLSDGGNGASAMPLYNRFVEQAQKLHPHYLTMIIPARWFAGGRALSDFRANMLNDNHIRTIVDYAASSECFPGVNVAGGICYFLWDKDYFGPCNFINVSNGECNALTRDLNEFNVLIRNNIGVSILRKIQSVSFTPLSNFMANYNPFLIRSYERGAEEPFKGCLRLYSSKGIGYIPRAMVTKGIDLIDSYKVMMTYAMSGGNKPSSTGDYMVIPATMKILNPGEVCTETYLCIGKFNSPDMAENLLSYMSTKFMRFLLLQTLTSIHITKENFEFVPLLNYSKPWTDKELYEKYGLTEDEITFIESTIKPMDAGGDLNA